MKTLKAVVNLYSLSNSKFMTAAQAVIVLNKKEIVRQREK